MIKQKLQKADWELIANEMHEKGVAIIPNILTDDECSELIQNYNNPDTYRKTVVMERYRFGLGEYKYFNYPLPELIQQIRTEIYPQLVPIANLWFKALNIDRQFPKTHRELLQQCHENTLHPDLYGDVYFPIQTVLFLNEPDKGTKGYYRVNMKHGVSEIHSGQYYTLGIIFHDAIS